MSIFLSYATSVHAAQSIAVYADRVSTPQLDVRGAKMTLSGTALYRVDLRLAKLAFAGQQWRDFHASCNRVTFNTDIVCSEGLIHDATPLPFDLRYTQQTRALVIHAKPGGNESWQLNAAFAASAPNARLQIKNGVAARFAGLLPAGSPRIEKGLFNTDIIATSSATPFSNLRGSVDVNGLDFSDPRGIHAGQKIAARLDFSVNRNGARWDWQTRTDWREGELYWEPFYLKRLGPFLTANGSITRERLVIESADLRLDDAGYARFSLDYAIAAKRIESATLRSENLDLARLYPLALKPMLESKGFGELKLQGRASINASIRAGELRRFDALLNDVSIEEPKKKLSLTGLNARLPWVANQRGEGSFRFAGAKLGEVPIGAVRGRIESDGWRFSVPNLPLPIFDGSLTLQNLQVQKQDAKWVWSFQGGVTPISMESFSRAMKWPLMHGTLSAVIPEVSYSNETVTVTGALLFRVFDGSVVLKNLKFIQPLGRVPRLLADVDMNGLDLDLLTRTFSFGSMEGRIDVDVANLELLNWRPVRFDAKLASSAGDYRKTISQQAVQNISSLGGAGPAAAIQRSFLRFFERFGYQKIGLSCVLRNEICTMDGVEGAAQGYVIVKGGGIPAITVIGYNRRVDWDELLSRIQRITKDNVKPIIR